MTQAAVGRRYGDVLKHVTTEHVRITAPWESRLSANVVDTVLPAFIVLLRLTMGWVFVWAGFDKLIRGFNAEGWLLNATQGPLGGWYQSLGANQMALDVINPMIVWSQILIGLALIFGVGFRLAAFWGAAQMFMFYIGQFPPAHNPFMDYYLVYILALGLLGALGAGRILGLDGWIEKQPLVRRIPGASFLLG